MLTHRLGVLGFWTLLKTVCSQHLEGVEHDGGDDDFARLGSGVTFVR